MTNSNKNFDVTKLKQHEQDLYKYITSNLGDVINMSANELAEKCFCSSTSINRFCKKMGYTGFAEFKLHNKIMTNQKDQQRKLGLEDINANQIDEVAKLLEKDKFIAIYGKGASHISALYLNRQLRKLGFMSGVFNDLGTIELVSNAIVIVISSSGTNNYTLSILDLVKKKTNKTIAITANDSLIANKVDVALTHDVEINMLNVIEKEQQLHLIKLINNLIYYIIDEE